MDELQLVNRLRRIHAALDATVEVDLGKLEAKLIETEHGNSVYQDFSGGLSPEELENLAFSLIHNIANLHDHLRRWAARTDARKEDDIDDAFHKSLPLKIMKDLSNVDKHGPPRNRGFSGLAPRLEGVRRSLRITAKPNKGVEITMGPRGTPQLTGEGSAKAILTGEVVDSDGNRIGELMGLATAAITAWETVARDLGLQVQDT